MSVCPSVGWPGRGSPLVACTGTSLSDELGDAGLGLVVSPLGSLVRCLALRKFSGLLEHVEALRALGITEVTVLFCLQTDIPLRAPWESCSQG